MRIKLSKCQFALPEVEVLGHLVSAKGVRVDPKKMAAIARVSHPRTKTQLRAFLGMCSFHRRFIRGFAQIAAPLHQLTASDKKKGGN